MELLLDPDFAPGGLLCAEESDHCVRVLRHREGDQLLVTDGRGTLHTCLLTRADRRGCHLTVVSSTNTPPSNHPLRLAVAPTKNQDRYEWMVEKAVEIGVSTITPLITARTERATLRHERLLRVATAACKQSLKTHMPRVEPPTPLAELLRAAGQRFILHCEASDKTHLFAATHPGEPATVLVGPEGDFTPDEIAQATRAGYQPCSLGPERLRTETAAIVAATLVNLKNQLTQ